MSLRDYTVVEPVAEEKMKFRNPENTICELLRRTYMLTEDPQVRLNLRVCVSMAKSMGEKLHWYRKRLKEVEDEQAQIDE